MRQICAIGLRNPARGVGYLAWPTKHTTHGREVLSADTHWGLSDLPVNGYKVHFDTCPGGALCQMFHISDINFVMSN